MVSSIRNRTVLECHPEPVEGWQSHFDKLSVTLDVQ